MSYVSGVTLIFGLDGIEGAEAEGDDDAGPVLRRLGEWPALRDVSGHSAGKHPQCCIVVAGLNYLDEDAFAAAVMALPWKSPENVVLVIQPEDGRTRVWRPPAAAGWRLIGAPSRERVACPECAMDITDQMPLTPHVVLGIVCRMDANPPHHRLDYRPIDTETPIT